MTALITLTIDERTVRVPAGMTVLQACQRARTRVPYYCYHPGLSIAGNCRICMVEIEGMPKLQISCNTTVREGMVVRTKNDRVQAAQKEVLEFLLINHPLDCPVCDQAGECELQNYYLEFGAYDPKFNEAKHKKVKMQPIGKNIMLDAERCILCSRCVRFCDEVTKTGEFGIFNRGDHAEIGIYPGQALDNNNYSGNVADICPVGALTDRDFRFKCRVWYLGTQQSVCGGCSKGCNIHVHYNKELQWRPHKAGGARVIRLRPRYNADVNQWWMCDEGRYGFHHVDERRLTQPLLATEGRRQAVRWDVAIRTVCTQLQPLITAGQQEAIGVIASTYLTNEDLFMVKRVFQDTWRLPYVTANLPLVPGASDDLLMQADKSPNVAGAAALGLMSGLTGEDILRRAADGQIRVLWVFGHDLHARFGEERVRLALARVECVIYQGSNRHALADIAHIALPSTAFVEHEGTWTNAARRVQRVRQVVPPLGDARPNWQVMQWVGTALGYTDNYTASEQVFTALAAQYESFCGMTYQRIGTQGAPLHEK